jgi:hypothetical protein
MKKLLPKPASPLLVLALIIFGFFFIKSMITIFSPYRFVYQENPAALSGAGARQESLSFPDVGPAFDRLRARNFFLSATVTPKPTPGAAAEAAGPPPPNPNEVRDEGTGVTFKYLGTIALGEAPLAFFARVGPVPKGEARFLFRPKGKTLSKNLRVEDVGAKSVKINQGGKKTELNVFYIDIKRLGTEKKAPQK